MRNVVIILRKEWLELRQERALLLSIVLLPLLLTVLPLGVVYAIGLAPVEDFEQMGAVLADPVLGQLAGAEQAQALVGKQFGMLFLLMPLFIPTVIAAYSIVGEKTRRTLEPLLATPVRTIELLSAKSLAALIPALGITWVFALGYIGGMAFVVVSPDVFRAIVNPTWLLVQLLLAPLLAMIAIALSVGISSRVNDPRTAQQVSGVVVVPVIAAIGGQAAGLVVLSPLLVVATALVLLLIVAAASWLAFHLFQREVILTRWK